MADHRDIAAVVSELTSFGGGVRLDGARPQYDLAAFRGPPELLDELGLRSDEVAGLLALRRPRRILPAIPQGAGPPFNGLSSAQLQWSDPARNPLQEQWLPVVWKLEGLLNVDAMKQSFNHLLDRHRILRTRYLGAHGAAIAEVMPASAFALDVVDLTSLPADHREREIWKRMKLKYDTVTSLESGVVDLRLYRVSERHHVLGGFIHHIAMDAASLAIVLGELMARYYGGLFGKETGEEEALQYDDFVRWEQGWLTEDERRLSDGMWLCQLASAGVEPRRGPRDGRCDDYDVLPIVLPKETFDAAQSSARKNGATLNIYFLAALSLALGELHGQRRAVFGQITRGRPPGFDTAVGSFIQMRPYILEYRGEETFTELLKKARMMYAFSTDLGRPASPQILDRFGIGRIVVNYTRRAENGSGVDDAPPGSGAQRSGKVHGVFTTTTIHQAGGILERKHATQIPGFFTDSSSLAGREALSQPVAGNLSVRRNAVRAPGPRKMLGLAAAMSRLSERLQTEFHRDLHFAMVQSPANLSGVVTYNRQVVSRQQADRLVATIARVMEAAARDPLQKVCSLLGGSAPVAACGPETA